MTVGVIPQLPPELAAPRTATAATTAAPTFAVSALHCTDHVEHEACRYQVAWTINPHMEVGAVDFARALVEHGALLAALAGAGATLEQLPFVHGAYDSVFVKDPALLLERGGGRRAVLARFRHSERARERVARAEAYASAGFDVVGDDRGPLWEGGDVVMLPARDGLLLGYGFRSQRAAARWLEHHTGLAVWPVELVDPHLYHLDMALAMLPDGTALVCPWALAPGSLRVLEHVPGLRRIVPVSRASAVEFGLNLIAFEDTVVLGAHDPKLESLLRSLGYRCTCVPLRQFHLAGGSAACLVAAVHREPVT